VEILGLELPVRQLLFGSKCSPWHRLAHCSWLVGPTQQRLVCFHSEVDRLDLPVLLLVGWPERSFSLFSKLLKTKDVACAIGRMAGLGHFKLRAH
jgi:hypothetical protein